MADSAVSSPPAVPSPRVAAFRPGRLSSLRWAVASGRALAHRPDLWVTAVRQIRLLAPDAWWRRAPFLPVPDRRYLAFRLQTMYGDGTDGPAPGDVVTYLHWCRAWPRIVNH